MDDPITERLILTIFQNDNDDDAQIYDPIKQGSITSETITFGAVADDADDSPLQDYIRVVLVTVMD